MERTELEELLRGALPGIDWNASERLVDDRIVNSLDLMAVLTALHFEKGIRIPGNEMKAENFNSVEAMLDLCRRYETGRSKQ